MRSLQNTSGSKRVSFLLMLNNSQQIVQKLWSYRNVLRDDGLSYGDYVEQLTYLLFLKMADERTKPPVYIEASAVPAQLGDLIKKNGDELFDHYRHVLEKLGNGVRGKGSGVF